ncbi:hypothetical protein FSY45_10700 [Comamonas sp. Z1]|uniref:hypothetical protein n=1 Tax=Comamonas sp. Z1 TaxID=2601246 RepID=UPI0011E6DDDF|nr:hypothetical protein [Comamonas sp. Z1]TYK76246.1 hypothetical protein FSY45_10700 [Comamonas sp. Z1]
MSKTVRTSPISPPPGQQDQSARLAASAKVDQVEGTIYRPINEYLDWLYAELARLNAAVANPGQSCTPDLDIYQGEEVAAALRVYMRFVAFRLGRA